MDGGDQYAVPTSRRLHGSSLAGQHQCLEQAVAGHTGVLEKEFKALEEKSWKTVEAETEDGVYCTTGTGSCPAGTPGKLKLVKPSESDLKARDRVLNEVVLKEWAKRCGEACAAKWTEIIGKKYGLAAMTN